MGSILHWICSKICSKIHTILCVCTLSSLVCNDFCCCSKIYQIIFFSVSWITWKPKFHWIYCLSVLSDHGAKPFSLLIYQPKDFWTLSHRYKNVWYAGIKCIICNIFLGLKFRTKKLDQIVFHLICVPFPLRLYLFDCICLIVSVW